MVFSSVRQSDMPVKMSDDSKKRNTPNTVSAFELVRTSQLSDIRNRGNTSSTSLESELVRLSDDSKRGKEPITVSAFELGRTDSRLPRN